MRRSKLSKVPLRQSLESNSELNAGSSQFYKRTSRVTHKLLILISGLCMLSAVLVEVLQHSEAAPSGWSEYPWMKAMELHSERSIAAIGGGSEIEATDCSFLDASTGWVATKQGALYGTEDGGKTWKTVFKREGFPISQVALSDRNHGVILGSSGIFLTWNEGQNWSGYLEEGGADMFAAYSSSDKFFWAVIYDGGVYGGDLWEDTDGLDDLDTLGDIDNDEDFSYRQSQDQYDASSFSSPAPTPYFEEPNTNASYSYYQTTKEPVKGEKFEFSTPGEPVVTMGQKRSQPNKFEQLNELEQKAEEPAVRGRKVNEKTLPYAGFPRFIAMHTATSGIAGGDLGVLATTADGGETWLRVSEEKLPSEIHQDGQRLEWRFLGGGQQDNHGVALVRMRKNGRTMLLEAADGIMGSWREMTTNLPNEVLTRALTLRVSLDKSRAFLLCGDGSLFGSQTSDLTQWEPLSRQALVLQGVSPEESSRGSSLLPAPLTLLLLCTAVVILLVLLIGQLVEKKIKLRASQKKGIEENAVSDRPLSYSDQAGQSSVLVPLAQGMSEFIRNKATEAPLTISVEGSWGAGKSSLMNLCHERLSDSYQYPSIWFNPWHHQTEKDMLAFLLGEIKSSAAPSARKLSPYALSFWVNLISIRLRKQWLSSLTYAALVAGVFTIADKLLSSYSDTLSVFLASPAILIARKQISRIFVPFSIQPDKLLDTSNSNTESTSIRHQFCEMFEEVTEAMGDRKFVIYIDDIDRCSPSQVMKLLEMTNFLHSAGPCIVVLGMDYDKVRGIVEKQLKELGLEVEADNYLEKLIQVRMEVPKLSQDQKRELIATSHESRTTQFEPIGKLTGHFKSLIACAAMVGVVCWVLLKIEAYHLTENPNLEKNVGSESSPPPVAEAVEEATASNPAAEASTEEESTPDRSFSSGDVVSVVSPEPEITQVQSSWALYQASWGLGVIVIFLGWLLYHRYKAPDDLIIEDQDSFKEAMQDWSALLSQHMDTPRMIKLYQNRMRFFSTLMGKFEHSLEPQTIAGFLALRRCYGEEWVGRLVDSPNDADYVSLKNEFEKTLEGEGGEIGKLLDRFNRDLIVPFTKADIQNMSNVRVLLSCIGFEDRISDMEER